MRDRKAPALEVERGAREEKEEGSGGRDLGGYKVGKNMCVIIPYLEQVARRQRLEARIMLSQVLACLEELRKSRARENDVLTYPAMWCFTRNDPELGKSGKQSLRSDGKAAKCHAMPREKSYNKTTSSRFGLVVR